MQREVPLGQTAIISVEVIDVNGLYGYDIQVFWNNTILQCQNAQVTPPSVWGTDYAVAKNLIENSHNSTHGRYWLAVSALTPAPPFDGTTTLATLEFDTLTEGSSTLKLQDTSLADSDAQPIEHTRTDGIITATGQILEGDVDGDGDVDIFDIVRIASAYGSELGDPNYDPACDIDGDGDVDIFDLVKAAVNYGKTLP